jgi:hypothetical protein
VPLACFTEPSEGLVSIRSAMASQPRNRKLSEARTTSSDEFYTQLSDIERELKGYKKHFKDKVVYCNCDDPRVSNFFHYFSYNFERLGLKRLITTCYRNQHANLFSQNASDRAISMVYDGDRKGNRVPDPEDIGIEPLDGNGDFRSDESIELLKQADIVVTNPPFSLFREYVAQLIEHDKKFIIVGSLNAITLKEIFKLIRDDKLWLGYGFQGGNAYFAVPDPSGYAKGVYDATTGLVKFRNVTWFTNLDNSKRHEDLTLYRTYKPDDYVKFENFDAINVNKLTDIPVDYAGAMGVPITFLDKYNPDQFEILGIGIAGLGLEAGVEPFKPEHKEYRRKVQGRGAVDGDLYLMVDGVVEVPYRRILVRNKHA